MPESKTQNSKTKSRWLKRLKSARDRDEEEFEYTNNQQQTFLYTSTMAKNGKLRLYKKVKRIR